MTEQIQIQPQNQDPIVAVQHQRTEADAVAELHVDALPQVQFDAFAAEPAAHEEWSRPYKIARQAGVVIAHAIEPIPNGGVKLITNPEAARRRDDERDNVGLQRNSEYLYKEWSSTKGWHITPNK